MKRLLAIALVSTLFIGVASANAHENLDVGPGMVGADSPLYGLETAWDNAAVNVGLKKAGTVAQERAAEAKDAQDRGNHEAAQRAAEEMNNIAQKAQGSDAEGLQKAEAVLQGVMENAPEEAQAGLQTALDNVRNARDRAQQARDRAGDQAGNQTADAQERMSEARATRENGRQQIQEGNADLDAGNYDQAEQHFQQAQEDFQTAEDRVAGLSSTEAQELRTQLEHSQEGAMDLVNAVQAYQDGDNTTAQQYAQDAQDSFDSAGQAGGAR